MLSLDGTSPLRGLIPVLAPVMETFAEARVAKHKATIGRSFLGDFMVDDV